MTRSATSRHVTIFEGPDGGGKSTLAQEYAQLTQARYVHHGPYKQVGDGLSRMFLESMLPALLGYQDVVLDRCWLSEPIYADAYRQGNDRVGLARCRVLDRLALRCGAVVVKCLPPWAHVRACFTGRVADEYLDNEQQLLQVYGEYQHDLNSHLHEVEHNYVEHLREPLSLTVMTGVKPLVEQLRARNPAHSLRVNSTGNWEAPIVLVGENFGERKNNDALYQAPFGSLNGNGCSLWLADRLAEADISEQSLLWVNADELDEDWLHPHRGKQFIALGEVAYNKLMKLKVVHAQAVPHPQYAKRFQAGTQYSLIPVLQEVLRATHPH